MNSVNESLYYGVPMVLFPQHIEQGLVAKRTAELTKNEIKILSCNDTHSNSLILSQYKVLRVWKYLNRLLTNINS